MFFKALKICATALLVSAFDTFWEFVSVLKTNLITLGHWIAGNVTSLKQSLFKMN